MSSKVLVLGGTGFIGRHAVDALLRIGVEVCIGTRNPTSRPDNCSMRKIVFEDLLTPDDWETLIGDVDAVLNCVGKLRQRARSTYDRVHCLAPAALAGACASLEKRLVHVSALGLDPHAKSRFISSKIRGETKIQESGAEWAIARPSLLDGRGGFGARWLRGVSHLPAFFTPSGAKGRIAALDVMDLGEALARLSIAPAAELSFDRSQIFELGGEQHYEFHEYIRALRRTHTDKPSFRIQVPNQLARLFAHFCDLIHFTPFSFGHWEMLQRDNKPTTNRLAELLGRSPTSVPLKLGKNSDE